MDLGDIRRFKDEKTGEMGDPVILLDSKVKSVTMEVEFWDKEKKATYLKTVELVPNDKGRFYIYCNEANQDLERKLKNDWITQDRFSQQQEYIEKNNVSRILSAKVE